MSEERARAAEQGIPSPVWGSINQTHDCYDTCMRHILDNLDEKSLLFIASHNDDSIEMAKDIMNNL